MKTESILSKSISAAGNKASYDAACKRLLANKEILAWIMKSCLEEYKNCNIQEIISQYIEGEPYIGQVPVNVDERLSGEQINNISTEDSSLYEGTVTYDIRFYAEAPGSEDRIQLIINIEAQNDFYPGYPIVKRGIYYCSRMISSQYGTEFTFAHYENIKKVYSIWICMNPPKYRKNTITGYFITEKNIVGNVKEKIENYDLLATIIICLGDSNDKNTSKILRLLEVLLSPTRDANEKKKILQDDFAIKMTKNLERQVSTMCNLSKGVEEKGIEKGILFSIKSLMETMGWSAEQAMRRLKIPEAERSKYIIELKDKD